MGRETKAAAIVELRERLVGAQSAVLTDYRGLSVADMTELRSLLRKSAVEYRVTKNTLVRLALKETGLTGLDAYLAGPTAIAISQTDPVAPSKVLAGWAKGRPTFTIKGGAVEGRICGPAEIAALGELPSREVLLGRMASAFQGPIRSVASVLVAPIRGLVTVLDQVRQQRERAGAA